MTVENDYQFLVRILAEQNCDVEATGLSERAINGVLEEFGRTFTDLFADAGMVVAAGRGDAVNQDDEISDLRAEVRVLEGHIATNLQEISNLRQQIASLRQEICGQRDVTHRNRGKLLGVPTT